MRVARFAFITVAAFAIGHAAAASSGGSAATRRALGALMSSALAQESELDSLRAAAKSRAGDAATALPLGRALRRSGRYADALVELRRGLAIGGSSPDVISQLHWEVARVHMDRHDFPGAMVACRALGALHASGASAAGHACAADAHLVWQRATEALAESQTALSIDPGSYEAKVAEGRAYEFALDVPKGEAAFREAIARRPDSAEAHTGLGRVLLKAGKKEDGIRELRRSVAIDPGAPDASYDLAVALPAGDESRSLLERATRERPTFADAWLALGVQELVAGRFAQAKTAAAAAVRADPNAVASHVLLGKVALAEGTPDEAIHEGEAALKILPNASSAKLLIADAHATKGDLDGALEAYQAAWGLDHGDPAPLVRASQACHAGGRDTSARAFAVKATQEFPHWAPGWVAMGDALAGQKETAAARDAYAKAMASDGPVDRETIRRTLDSLPAR